MSITSLGVALKVPPLGANNLDPATAAFVAKISAVAGSISATHLNAADAWITASKNRSYLPKLHLFCPFLGDDHNAARVPLIDVSNTIPAAEGGFDADNYDPNIGVLGDGSAYLISGYNLRTYNPDGDVHFGAWCKTNAGSGLNFHVMGADDGSTEYRLLFPRGNAGASNNCTAVYGGSLFPARSDFTYAAQGSEFGHIVTQVQGTTHRFYRRGTLRGTNSSASKGVKPDANFYILSNNDNGSPNNTQAQDFACVHIGEDFTDSEQADFYDDLLVLMQPIGRA